MPAGTRLGRLLAACCALLALAACALPPLDGRPPSEALPAADGARTTLGKVIAPLAASHSGLSGIAPLADAHDAFAARILLARTAERTLDIQSYIWRNDVTGTLMLQALYEAAERGVRVRLLLDDNGIAGLDTALAVLDAHPRIEVRLVNPFVVRSPKAIGFLTDFRRLNRRMHNKSFTADNQATIVGGRNIGDEYFGAQADVLFADLDVLAVGHVVPEVSADFDRYWASDSAYPADRLLRAPGDQDLAALRSAYGDGVQAARVYLDAVRRSAFIRDLLAGKLGMSWSRVSMVSDDPAKLLGQAPPEDLITHGLMRYFGEPAHRFDLVSPYLVPTASGVDAFAGMVARGVRVRILTNALEATDVVAVHAGYAKRRRALLDAGVVLYEMRRETTADGVRERAGPFGSSGSSLHAKTFAVDDARLFVGSFNFDPRSALLNTELGFVIEDPGLARTVTSAFDHAVPRTAYRVMQDADGNLSWLEIRDGDMVVHAREPGAGVFRRAWIGLLSILPIEGML